MMIPCEYGRLIRSTIVECMPRTRYSPSLVLCAHLAHGVSTKTQVPDSLPTVDSVYARMGPPCRVSNSILWGVQRGAYQALGGGKACGAKRWRQRSRSGIVSNEEVEVCGAIEKARML